MHLVLISAFHYPNGGPAAARHLALASGLIAEGNKLSVILLNQVEPVRGGGVAEAISWVTVAAGGDSPIKWRLRAARRLGPALDAIANDNHVDAVLLTGLDPILLKTGVIAARKRGMPVLHELTEYPDVVGSSSVADRLGRLYFERHLILSFDAMLVISRALNDYVRDRSNVPVKVLAGMVNLSLHRPFPGLALGSNLAIGYAGSLSEAKDGVLTLLAAVANAKSMLSPNFEIKVHILGDVKSPHGRLAVDRARSLGLESHVKFHGLIPHAEVRERLQECHVLVLPRPDSRQARGGFPTKLGEYLSSGRPVLATSVGDIPLYLTNRENCLMVGPGDESAIAEALVYAAHHYDDVRNVGKRGRELVEKCFDANGQAKELVSFIEQYVLIQ